MAEVRVVLADPDRHAAAVAQIYRPAVETGLASFEEVPPGTDEMAERMRRCLAWAPWLVALEADEVAGYAYAGRHKERAGYRWSVDLSAYVRGDRQGQGIGRLLYDDLLVRLRRQRFVNAYAGITLPNDASVALHTAIGMRQVGVYERIGHKFGAWHSVAWYAMRLTEPGEPPPEPIPLPELGR